MTTIIGGAADFLGAALIIVLARGITVVMKNTYMTDTVLHWMEDAVSGTSRACSGSCASWSTCRSRSWSRRRPVTRRW